MWIDTMFGVKKPIITMLHLDPLPGDPRFHHGDYMDRVVEHARADLHALQDGGVDGIMNRSLSRRKVFIPLIFFLGNYYMIVELLQTMAA